MSTSCTKDVAIAKLLGKEMRYLDRNNAFQHDSLRQKRPEYLNEVGIPIFKELKDQRDAAQRELDEAIASGQQIYIDDCKLQLSRLDDLIRRAHRYSCDIEDEISKENTSMLRVDKYATKTLSNPLITLNSLDQWARQKYQISILESDTDVAAILETKSHLEQPSEQFPLLGGLGPESTLVGQTPKSAADDDADDTFVDRKQSDGLSRTVADNLYITLALLIEHYVQDKGPEYKKPHGRITVKNVAKDVLALIAAATKDKPLPGQGHRTIVGHITEALRTKDQVQRELYGSRSSK